MIKTVSEMEIVSLINVTPTSVPGKRRVSGQKPDGNGYLTRHWQKRQSAKVIKVLYFVQPPWKIARPLAKKN